MPLHEEPQAADLLATARERGIGTPLELWGDDDADEDGGAGR